jgi:hypothetical protein
MGISLKIEAYGALWEFVLSSGIEIGKFKLVAQTRFLIKNFYMFN